MARFSLSFLNQRVTELWNGVQTPFAFGPATAASRQVGTYFFIAGYGFSNYNAGFLSYRTRRWKGLSLDANFTWAHSLDTAGVNQDFDTADPNAVFNSFRPTMISLDTTSSGGGQLRGLDRWNLDLTVARRVRIAERASLNFNAQFCNFFNAVMFNDPAVSLQRPQSFGVISSQMNSPRIVQLGLQVNF